MKMTLKEFVRKHRHESNYSNRQTVRSLKQVHWAINERAACRARLDEVIEDGRFAIIREGMDCDSTQYRSISIYEAPTSLFAFVLGEDKHRDWLDGPESTYFDQPSKYPDGDYYASRDRALEAFENGHPHSVTLSAL